METGRLEKRFQMWNRLLYMLLRAAIFGYFVAGWINLISSALILEDRISGEYKMLVAASSVVIVLGYA